MKLQKITVENYRSIEKVSFDIVKRDDKSFTYGLIGINEAGKSSILKAIGLKDGLTDAAGNKLPLAKDFRDKSQEIAITYSYTITPKEDGEIYEILNRVEEVVTPPVDSQQVIVSTSESEEQTTPVVEKEVKTKKTYTKPLTLDYVITFKEAGAEPLYRVEVFSDDVEVEDLNNKDKFDEFIDTNVHKTIFWTAEDRYLISKPINIEQFVADTNTSIPLRNCFLLASIKESDIKEKLSEAQKDSTDCEYLEKELGEKVTEHIKAAWPNHPIEITFKILDGHMHFHVKDVGVKGKAQTSDMRSDGFKQFVSFLLTVSAENKNEELSNAILLLDEPETHLHPKAQEYLLTQLINITNNKKDNVVFFATHSNYMIDKNDLGKYYRVQKIKNSDNKEYTEVKQFDNKQTSYAEVSYEVFGILDEHYHNELYDRLRDSFIEAKNSKETDKSKHVDSIGINPFDEQYFVQEKKLSKDCGDTSKPNNSKAKVTLPTYVRNCIHYPANKKKDFETKLEESIKILREHISGN